MISFSIHRLAILAIFTLVLASTTVAAAEDGESQRVRGNKSMFKIVDQRQHGGNGLLPLNDSPLQDDTKFWERLLKGQGGSYKDPSSKNSSDDEPDEPQACPTPTPVDAEVVRAALKKFVATLDEASDLEPTRLERGYHPIAADQGPDYHMCTVVQQCLDPPFILSLGHMSAKSRGLAYKAVSKVMSQESFNMLQLQQHSNMLLGEMQDWATTCPGTCRQLLNFDGLLDPVPGGPGSLAAQSRGIGLVSYEECGAYRSEGTYTFWHCNEEPRMVHQAQIDVATGQYFLGNIWGEPHIHARNSWYDYFSAYGDLEENGGAFGLRFSGHHIDLNYRWNDEGVLVQDLPVFLGHNPLIVPEVSPPELRDHDQRAGADQFYFPLMWTNMAGVAQFAESEQLVLSCANQLLDIAPGSYVPLSNWTSTGYVGALQLLDQKITDFDYFDLSTASDSEFEKMWALVEYTLKFSRGKEGLASAERAIFRAEGKAVWTTSSPPEEGLPLTEDDLRSNLNFLNLRIETEDWVFFVMVNQLFTVISENEPTNHMHSVLIPKELISAEHACIADGDPLCVAPPRDEDDDHATERIASAYKYESLLWEERNLKGNVTLNVSAFDEALIEVSEELCDLGISATLFDENAEQIYQKSVGTRYFDFNGYLNHSDEQAGWNGDTRMSLYSNSKIVTAATFLAAVVDTGLGYLDEPIYLTFPEILTEADVVGRATPRMLLSHTSGIASYERSNLTDPYFMCIYDDTKTFSECLGEFLLTDDTITDMPGTKGSYRNEPFDVIAEIIIRKTGLDNFGEAVKKYLTGPIGMDNTTIDCPVVRSTSQKPHPSWGFCSTANDMAKLVQVLANKGKKADGTQVLSTYSVQQAFTSATGFATNGDSPLVGSFPITRCYNRVVETGYVNSVVGYGLGTMLVAGPKGLVMSHAGMSGGFWVVAPGRYSAYFGWMHDPAVGLTPTAYGLVASIVDRFELASTFMVANGGTFDGTSDWEDIETCGPYVDWWSIYGLTAAPWSGGSCKSTRRTEETRSSGEIEFEEIFLEEMAETLRDL